MDPPQSHDCWQLAALCQYLNLFQSLLKPFRNEPFQSQMLEEALLSTQPTPFLVDLHVHLLRTRTDNRLITSETWLSHLRKHLVSSSWSACWPLIHTEPPFYNHEGQELDQFRAQMDPSVHQAFVERLQALETYQDWSWLDRVKVLLGFCELLLDDADRFRAKMKADSDDQVSWRVDPIGWDLEERVFWFMDDYRLYRERIYTKKPVKKSGASRKRSSVTPPLGESQPEAWQRLCADDEDWSLLLDEKLSDETSRVSASFKKDLQSTYIPAALDYWKQLKREQHRKLQRELMEADVLPLKRSTRLRQKTIEQRNQASENDELSEKDDEDDEWKGLSLRERRAMAREQKRAVKQWTAPPSFELVAPSTGSWIFRCTCGAVGVDYDDGRPMVACERCSVWQHMECVDRRSSVAKRWDEDPFYCDMCTHMMQSTDHQQHVGEDRQQQEDDSRSESDEEEIDVEMTMSEEQDEEISITDHSSEVQETGEDMPHNLPPYEESSASFNNEGDEDEAQGNA